MKNYEYSQKIVIGCKIDFTMGESRKFERPHVERLVFRNLKIANVKSYEVQFFDFFIYELVFSFRKNLTSNFRFFKLF